MLHSGEESALPMQEIQEMRVQFLGQEYDLEEELVTLSSMLDWEIPRTEKATVHSVTKSWTRLK